jgi:hypothetical protein
MIEPPRPLDSPARQWDIKADLISSEGEGYSVALTEVSKRLGQSAAAWPDDASLVRTAKLRATLSAIKDDIAGVSLCDLKSTDLPAWKDRDPAVLAKLLPKKGASALEEPLEALGLSEAAAGGEQIGNALVAARVLRGLGSGDAAARVLRDAARAALARAEGTFFALWLFEVAEQWLDQVSCERLRCQVSADLGVLIEQAGDRGQGIRLIRTASGRLFKFAGQQHDDEARLAALQMRYDAVKWAWRNRVAPDLDAVPAELTGIVQEAPEGSAVRLHATLELLAVEAAREKLAANIVTADQTADRLATLALPTLVRKRLQAHVHQARGRNFALGSNHFLHTRARDEYKAAADLFEAAGDWSELAQTLDALGRVASMLGDHDDAGRAFQRSIALKQHFKDLWGLGASLNGQAVSLHRRGQATAAVAYYEANLTLLEHMPDTPKDVVLQNLGHIAGAWMMAYQNPLEADQVKPVVQDLQNAAATLKRYLAILQEQPPMGFAVSRAFYLMLKGALARLLARVADEPAKRLELLAEGATFVRQALTSFQKTGQSRALPNAEIHLAGILIDHARLLPQGEGKGPERIDLLAEAARMLGDAEKHVWDSYERAYLALEWAWYHRTQGAAATAENFIAAARRHATALGNRAIQVSVESSMGVQLQGPTGKDRWEVVLPPGQTLDIPVMAIDWCGRPLAGYALAATAIHSPGAVVVEVPAPRQVTNSLGQASFTVRAVAGQRGTVFLEVRDHSVLREARVEIHVQPFTIELDPNLAPEVRPTGDDEVVLRHLFGQRFQRVIIRKEFKGGLGGAQVLLVEPYLAPPQGLKDTTPTARQGEGDGEGEGLEAQHCLIKLGDRRWVHAEATCYEKHVRDILSVNVSRIATVTVWRKRAGIRMSLAGDQEWDRAVQEMEWLVEAPPMETHHLLADMFVRDLGRCWHSNGSVVEKDKCLFEVYGRQFPIMLTVRETGPAEGLHREAPRAPGPPTLLTQALRPPGRRRVLKPGDPVYLGELEISDWIARGPNQWEYRLATPEGLRVAFHTQLPPEFLEPDSLEDNLLGQRFHVVGLVEQLLYDRLAEIFQECTTIYLRDHPDQKIELSEDGTTIKICTGPGKSFVIPNPHPHLHGFLELPLQHRRSIIHGDLHARNVIVNPRGMPYYIDFSETGIGPTLFDFVKHEVALWDWDLASVPVGAPQCSLAEALRLMDELTPRDKLFPAPFKLPAALRRQPSDPPESRKRQEWLAKFYQCVVTLRSLAQRHLVTPDEPRDYFTPLCLYAALILRWCDPRTAKSPDKKSACGRRGVFLTTFAGMLLKEGVAGPAGR